MAVVEAKLSVKSDGPSSSSSPPPPPVATTMNSIDMLNGELTSLELEEKPKDGVGDGASGIDESAVDATNSVDMLNGELMSLELEEKPEDGVSDGASGIDEPAVDASPDQHSGSPEKGEEEAEKGVLPSKKRRHRVRSKKQADDVQAAKDEHERSGSKTMGHNTWKVDEKEKKVPKRSFRQENVTQKQKGTPLKWVEQTDKKGLEEKKQTPSKRVEQENHENVVEKPKGTLQKLEKTEKKAVEEEKQTSSKRLEQEDHKVEEKEKKVPKRSFRQENVTQKQKGTPLKRVEQTEKKGLEEKKQTPSKRVEQEHHKAARKMSKENTSEKVGATQCKFYTMPGGCKFGKSCKYVHPQKKIEVDPVELNFLGLPIRPGEKECPFYMRTGNCKYATNCRYHHPDPTVASIGQDPLPPCQNSQPQQGFGASPLPVAPNPTQVAYHGATPFTFSSPSYSPGSNLHPQGFHSISEYNVYQVHTDEYPKQPGQLECQHFMKNGVCKFGSACKFRHPTVHLPPTEPFGTFNPTNPLQ
ncbi:zinc finger CCCH domain-containing protein 65 isoform X9 [Canna indica]|uniref:Zinc finger CCCH domain-containing protein 65 isoform X9 n=1 Tax=Canna indica TaxID=4628 RepID=A0AAQ3JXY6_9LILI|nr:zinc finger CCCH domain-containing protein 65 isoform X9 [Canna indica]